MTQKTGKPRQHNLDLRSARDDFLGVKIRSVGRILPALLICVALAGCASSSMHVASMGNNTYAITRQASTAFSRDTDALKAKAREDAAKFCANQGKQLQVVDILVEKPFFSTGYAQAKIIFKAVDAGNASLTGEPTPAAVSEKPTPVAVSEKPAAIEIGEKPPPVAVSEKPTPIAVSERPAAVEVSEKPAPVAVNERPATGDLYTELIKLDDLRKRGILTEEEFQAEKKKVLSRSK